MPDSVITVAVGQLPPPACWGSGLPAEQLRLEAFVAALTFTLTSPAEWIVQAAIPGAGDTGKLWLQLDSDGPNGLPLMAYRYAGGAWVRWFAFSIYRASTGAAGAYQITNSPPYNADGAAYRTGQQYRFKANHTNPGDATFQVDALSVKSIRVKVNQQVPPGGIQNGQMVTVEYDGVNFQMVSTPGAATIAAADIVPGLNGQTFRTRLISTGPDVLRSIWETDEYLTAPGAELALPAVGATASFTHGLQINGGAVVPNAFAGRLVCAVNDAATGYSVGDEMNVPSSWDSNDQSQKQWFVWANNLTVNIIRVVSDAGTVLLPNKTTGLITAVTADANFKLIAWAHI